MGPAPVTRKRGKDLERKQVVIYSRPECHLCDVAKQIIEQSGCEDLITLEVVNIDEDTDLHDRYKNDVPVIFIDGLEAFRHRLTPEEFRKSLV